MSTDKPVLGRGLSSLIPGSSAKGGGTASWGATMNTVSTGEQIVEIPIDAIVANPWQPRTSFDHDKLEELASSIKEFGIIQPLVVTLKAPGQYQLVAGERRLKAAKIINLATVPAVVRKIEDQKKLEISLIENVQRHNLNPLEEAVSYKRLMDEFSLTQEEVAQRVGKSRSSVANFLRLLHLPKRVLEALEQETITFSHAKVILSYQTEKEQLKAFDHIIRGSLSVAASAKPPRNPQSPRGGDPVLRSWEEKVKAKLGFSARIKKLPNGGVIEISFSSDEDLKALLDSLLQ